MAHIKSETGTTRMNFLESEVGLVLKTMQIPATMGVVDGSKKTVPAGTPYPSDDANAVGLTFTDTDVTLGDHEGSVMVAGRVLNGRLSITDSAKTALESVGIVFVDGPETTR